MARAAAETGGTGSLRFDDPEDDEEEEADDNFPDDAVAEPKR